MLEHYNIIEIAKGTPRNRGVLVSRDELSQHMSNEPLYRSMYTYSEDALEFAKDNNNSLRGYYGNRHIDNILVDVDKEQNTDEFTLNKCREILFHLTEDMDLGQNNFRIFFSGSGYHISIPNSVFNFKPGENLPFHVKETMLKLLPGIDPMVYIRTGIYRVAHTINKKTELYKIPLTYNEAMTLTYKAVHELAKTPRFDFQYVPIDGDGELEGEIVEEVQRVRKLGQVFEPNKIATCIQTMYKRGAQEGNRHTTLLRIVSHFRRHGVPSTAAKAALLEWNNGSLNEQEVLTQVEYSYNKGYQYGCEDILMSKDCNPKCIYYRRKDYLMEVKSSADMQKELEERLTTDFTGRSYPLTKALGLKEDCVFYPGDLITIFGPTGSSKTTLAHLIALGYDFSNDIIDENLQIPTLYLSLELSSWYMHRRSLQILSDQSKAEVETNFNDLYVLYKEKMQHINVLTKAPSLEQIQTKITELQPSMVIVDYIDLVETPPSVKGEYEQIKYISHGLSSMAVNNDVIIVQVSQVSRDYSRNEVLDLYAGKGSGAIENASRKVIGLNGQANSNHKQVRLFKNTDGELFETNLEWSPSFRLRRSNGF